MPTARRITPVIYVRNQRKKQLGTIQACVFYHKLRKYLKTQLV